MDIETIINNVYTLPECSLQKMKTNLTKMTYPKGSQLIKAGSVDNNIFFVAQGMVRAYIPVDGRDITFWFGMDGTTVFSLKSYVNNEPGYETVECIETTTVYKIRRETLQSLFQQDLNIANWGRKFAEKEYLNTEERLLPLLFTTAAERYTELLEKQPHLFLRIPLEHLASYLGITPVSLSRIRANIKRKSTQ